MKSIVISFALLTVVCGTHAGQVELVMPPFDVSHQGDVSVFSTPIDVQNGMVAVAFVTDADELTNHG